MTPPSHIAPPPVAPLGVVIPVLKGAFLVCAALVLTGMAPAQADWLVTVEGELIETEGAWKVEENAVIFTDADGDERRLALDDVDLEASKETTALKAGRTYEPPSKKKPPEKKTLEKPPAEMKAPEPKITLYMTSWCGYCRRTSALLEKLDVAFVEKDIEKDPAAAKEYREKGDGYRGIPLLDIDGTIIKGFRSELIYRLVHDLKRKEAAAEREAAAASS